MRPYKPAPPLSYLGLLYSIGDGVEKDDAKAVLWLTKAANQNHAEALSSLAENYEYGKGVAKNPAKALELLTKSAELGLRGSQLKLCLIYKDGKASLGISPDAEKAAYWQKRYEESSGIKR